MSVFSELALDLRTFDTVQVNREVLSKIQRADRPRMGVFEQITEVGKAVIQYRELLLFVRPVKITKTRKGRPLFELGIITEKGEFLSLFLVVAVKNGYEAVLVYGSNTKHRYGFTCPECGFCHEMEIEVDEILLTLAKGVMLLRSGRLSLTRLSMFGKYDDEKSFQTFVYELA